MKALLTGAILHFSFIASAQTPTIPVLDPGLYQGVITIQRSIPDLKTVDTTTLLVSAEFYYSPPDGISSNLYPTIIWTARNYDTSAKLANAWSRIQFNSLQFPQIIPDMPMSGTSLTVSGGTLVPGSYKNTRTMLGWKCTKEITQYLRRKTRITTTFSISRVGSLPEP